jgi:50S ribosomal subunit-associated GTPase HflX
VNSYLHSEKFLNDSEIEVDSQLDRLGIESGRGDIKSNIDRYNKTGESILSELKIYKNILINVSSKIDEIKSKKRKRSYLRKQKRILLDHLHKISHRFLRVSVEQNISKIIDMLHYSQRSDLIDKIDDIRNLNSWYQSVSKKVVNLHNSLF